MEIFKHVRYEGPDKFKKRIAAAVEWLKTYAGGDMEKRIYDTDDDGVVDNARRANGHEIYKDVPADAVFTDTVYDDTALRQQVRANKNNIEIIVSDFYNVVTYYLTDHQGRYILDSLGHKIIMAKMEPKAADTDVEIQRLKDRCASLEATVAALLQRKYLYWGPATPAETTTETEDS